VALQAELAFEILVGLSADGELVDIDRVRDHGDFIGGDAALDDVAAEAFANGRDGIRALEGMGFQRARHLVAQAVLGAGAVVDRGIFPEGAHLIDDRDAELAAGADGGDPVQAGRMRVQHVGFDLRDDFAEAFFKTLDHFQLVQDGQPAHRAF
jgi:hypothetical protein